MSKKTQEKKILTIMCQHPEVKWWFPYDFMKPELGDNFVGYEASARLSELATNYPDMVESERDGKYIKRRIRFETGKDWFWTLPKELRAVIKNEYRKPEVTLHVADLPPEQGNLL